MDTTKLLLSTLLISISLSGCDSLTPEAIKKEGDENLRAYVAEELVDYVAGKCETASQGSGVAFCNAIHQGTQNPIPFKCSYSWGNCEIDFKKIKDIKRSADYNMGAFAENALPGYKAAGCLGSDSDRDGYVTCTASSEDGSKQPASFECPYDNQLGVCKL